MKGAVQVVKIGGEVALDPGAVYTLLAAIKETGRPTIIVHGGGALASSIAERFGEPARMIGGRRITSDLDLQTILWSVCGEVNTKLVAAAGQAGITAVGLTGADAHLVEATRRPPRVIDGETIDFGHVGDVVAIHPEVVGTLLDRGFLPIIGTLGIGSDGSLLNINADTVAARLAQAVRADMLFLVTPSGGLRRDAADPTSLIDACTRSDFEEGVSAGWIAGGMRVKLEEAFACLDGGVRDVRVTDVAGIATNGGTKLLAQESTDG